MQLMLTKDELDSYLEEIGITENGKESSLPLQNKKVFEEIVSPLLQSDPITKEPIEQTISLPKKRKARLLPYLIFVAGMIIGSLLTFLFIPSHQKKAPLIHTTLPKEQIIEIVHPPEQVLR